MVIYTLDQKITRLNYITMMGLNKLQIALNLITTTSTQAVNQRKPLRML